MQDDDMCTSNGPVDVTVCDVALPDVRAALSHLPTVSFTHLPYEGTRVTGDAGDVEVFRTRLGEALAPHGGSLPAV